MASSIAASKWRHVVDLPGPESQPHASSCFQTHHLYRYGTSIGSMDYDGFYDVTFYLASNRPTL